MRQPQLFCLFCVVADSALPDKVDLYLTGIFKLVFNLLDYVAGDENHLLVVDDLGLDHYADLAAGLNSERTLNALKRGGDAFELFKALDVVLNILASCTGAGSRNCVGGLNEAGDKRLCLNVSVVSLNGVDNALALAVFFRGLNAQLNMLAVHLVVERLADIVEKAGSLCKLDVGAKFRRHETCNI